MKKIKKLAVIFLAGILTTSVAVGCGNKKPSAEEAAKAYCNLFVLSDPTGLQELGISDDDINNAINTQKSESKMLTKANLTQAGFVINDDQLDQIYNSQIEALKKLTITTEVISETKNTADVKIITNYADFMTADEKAGEDAINEVNESQITDKAKILDIYINNVTNNIKNIEPSTETLEETFNFKLEKVDLGGGKIKNMWTPTDPYNFGVKISKMAVGQK